ncbi:MAG: hypothetical protein ACJ79Y_06370, partial [Myxococcales bacterium]
MTRLDFAAVAAALIAFLAGCGSGTPTPGSPTSTPIVGGVVCGTGSTACGEACVQLRTDNANCGSCGHACGPGEVCSNGTCATTCIDPLTACGAGTTVACKDLRDDPSNCGTCGNVCPA